MLHIQILVVRNPNQKKKKNTRGKRSRADDTVSLGTATFLEQAIQKFIEVFFEQKFFSLSKRRPVSIKN